MRKKSEQLIEEESMEGLTTKKVSNHSRNLNFNHIFTDKIQINSNFEIKNQKGLQSINDQKSNKNELEEGKKKEAGMNFTKENTKKPSLLDIIQSPTKNSEKYTAYHSISDNTKE